MPTKTNNFAERDKIIEFNNFVRELGNFPIDKKDPNVADLVQTHCDEYRKLCTEYEITPTWEGLALALGKTRHIITQWRDGSIQWAKDAGVTEVLQKEWSWINSILVSSMTDGRVDKITGIFLARNNFGYMNEDQPMKKTEINVKLSMEQLIEGAKNLKAVSTEPEKKLVKQQDNNKLPLSGLREKEPSRKPKKPTALQLNESITGD